MVAQLPPRESSVGKDNYTARKRGIGISLLFLFLAVLSVAPTVQAQRLSLVSFNKKYVNFVYPVQGGHKSSKYGRRRHPIKRRVIHHHGVDIAAPTNAAIRAITDGIVVYADPHGGYGNFVVLKHANGLTSHYGHCNTLRVKVGQMVRGGDIVATVGSTGLSTGPHLHFEIRRNGSPFNPELLLPEIDTPGAG